MVQKQFESRQSTWHIKEQTVARDILDIMRGNAGGNPGVRFLSGYAANFMESFIAGCYDKWEVPAILCVCVCVCGKLDYYGDLLIFLGS